MARETIRTGVVLLRVKLLLLAVLLLASCDGTVYHRFEHVDSDGWSPADTLSFVYEGSAVSSGKESSPMAMTLNVRYGAGYKYRNLYVLVESFKADSSLLSSDTLCCPIYDERGRRLGSTAGSIYQNKSQTVPLLATCADTLVFKVSHLMNDTFLQEVLDIGLKLTSTN